MWRRRRRHPRPVCCLFRRLRGGVSLSGIRSRARVSSDGSNASHCFALPEVSRRRGPLRLRTLLANGGFYGGSHVFCLYCSCGPHQQLFCAGLSRSQAAQPPRNARPTPPSKLPCAAEASVRAFHACFSYRFKRTRELKSTDIAAFVPGCNSVRRHSAQNCVASVLATVLPEHSKQ